MVSEIEFTEWSAWSLVIFLLIGFAIYDIVRRAKEKRMIKCYKEITDQAGNKTISELKLIGEFKEENLNTAKRCFEFRMRHNFDYFNIYSNYTMSQYMSAHKIERNYLIYYSINCLVYERELKKKDYYKRELGWTIQAYIYRAFTFCFNLSSSGLIFSALIMGILFNWQFPDTSFSFFLGCGVGFGISIINYYLQKSDLIKNNLLKKKTEEITKETFMSPLESEEEILYVYRVKGTEEKLIETDDKAKSYRKEKLSDGNDKKGKPIEYKTITGYEELYKMQNNSLINIKKIKIVGTTTRKRTIQEMLNLKRQYLARNRAFAEENFRLRAENERLQKEYRSLFEQLSHIEETKDKDIKKFGMQFQAMKDYLRGNLASIYNGIYGEDYINSNFDAVHERVMRMLNDERQANKTNQMDQLIKAVKLLVIEIGKKANIDVSNIAQLLKIKFGENGGEDRTII